MNGRKRQRRRRTGSGDVVHVLIMYHVRAVSFIVVGTRALGRSRYRLVLDTRRNEIHIGDDSDTVEGLGLNDIAIVPFLVFGAACLDLWKMASIFDSTES